MKNAGIARVVASFCQCVAAGLLVGVLWLGLATPSAAQLALPSSGTPEAETVEVPEDLTPEAIDALVSRMSDEQVRGILLDQLHSQAVTEEAAPAANFGEFFFHVTVGTFATLLESFATLPATFSMQIESFRIFAATHGGDGGLSLFGALLAAVALGFAAEWLVNRLIRRRMTPPEILADPTLKQAVIFLARRIAREFLGIVVFFGVARIALNQILSDDLLPTGEAILLALITLPRLVYSVTLFALAPNLPEYRLVHTDDRTARFLNRHLVGLTIVVGLSAVLISFNLLNGLDYGAVRVGFWIDVVFRLYLIWVIWRSWDGLVSMMRGADPDVTPFEERVARAYPAFAIGAVLAMWWLVHTIISYEAIELLIGRPDIVTLALLLLAPAFDTLIRGLVRHLVPPMRGEGDVAAEAYKATKDAYKRIGRVVVFGIALILIAGAWNLTTEVLANAGAAGRVVEGLFDIGFVIALGYLSWELAILLVNRKLANERASLGMTPESAGAGEMGGGGGSRLSTVLPLFLGVVKAAIVVLFTLVGLSELGVDTTPLLAGAGIAGLAIGFGAQKLVTDVVSGAFFLMDDAFRVDEYVEIDQGTMGTVEKISIRSMRLRHHRGPVFTIPYGEVRSLKNYSRDWGIMKLEFTFPFDTDPVKVNRIFKQIGQDLLDHPEFGQDFLQPFKSQGVKEFNDVGMVIRGKFMAKPGKQWSMRKAIYTEVHTRLKEAGIPFARREVRVAIPDVDDPKNPTEEEKSKMAAAASAAVQDGMVPQK